MVMFYGGTWTQFFWALGTSIVAKWLARGFDDNKKRVAFEARLKPSNIQNVSKPDE
jgi:hypothetical protein